MLFNKDLITDDPRALIHCRHSHLEAFRESPAYFKAYYLDKTIEPDEPSAAMRIGLACDLLLLSKAPEKVVVIDEKLSRSTSKASMAKKEQIKRDAQVDGKTWLTQSEYDRVQRMVESARNNRDVSWLLDQPHQAQQQVFWECSWTGWTKRGSLDYLSKDFVIDLKTTGSWNMHPRRLPGHIFTMGNHRQLAHYQEGVESITGEILPTKLIYIGSDAPYAAIVLDVSGMEIDLGHQSNAATCDALEEAYAYNNWDLKIDKRVVFPEWAFR